MSNKPRSAADKRPNDEPFYIKKTCDVCGSKLVYADLISNPEKPFDEIWYDEFICPKCKGGLYMDWPKTTREAFKKMIEEAKVGARSLREQKRTGDDEMKELFGDSENK